MEILELWSPYDLDGPFYRTIIDAEVGKKAAIMEIGRKKGFEVKVIKPSTPEQVLRFLEQL